MTTLTDTRPALVEGPSPGSGRVRLGAGGMLVPLVIIGFYLIAAVIGPALVPYDPINTPLADRLKPPGAVTSTGATALLGTDALGRDLFGQIIHGARTSVIIGVCVVLISLGVGVLIGAVAGFRGGWIDAVLARCIDILQAFPGLVLAIVIAGIFARSLLLVIIALSVTNWISFARVTRGVVLTLRERYWVDAARLMGVPGPLLLIRHVLPFTAGPLVAMATLEFALVVLAEAGLSFLGIGLPSSIVSWGQTVAAGRAYLASAWWISAWPGLALSVLVVSVGILGDQLTARFGRARSR
ncbi:ABC transporter permease [Microlunatus parietis]